MNYKEGMEVLSRYIDKLTQDDCKFIGQIIKMLQMYIERKERR